MRVLHVLEELSPSGAERMLELAGPLWQAHDVQSQILSKGNAPGTFRARLEAAGYAVHHLPTTPQHSYPARLFNFLRRYHVEIVHNHSEHAHFWTAASAKGAGVPAVVRTVHSNFSFTGALRVERAIQRRLLRTMGVRTIATSESVRRNEKDRFGNPADLVENWYDADAFVPATSAQRDAARATFGLARDRPVAAVVGNCNPVKDHLRMLRALASPALSDVICLHAGREDDAGTERRLASELGVAARCLFLGPDADIQTVLRAADVFVMPSVYEGFGIAALEAISTGMPVVLSRTPGLVDLAWIEAGVSWVEAESELAASVRGALDQLRTPTRRDEIHHLVAQHYGAARGVAQYAAIYHEAMRYT